MPDHEEHSKGYCGWCGDTGCNQCDDRGEEYDYYDPYEDVDPDDYGYFEFNCGMTSEGYCMKAGSEECDWDCPTRHRRFLRSRVRNWGDKIQRRVGNLVHLIIKIRKLRRMKCECGYVQWTVYTDGWLCDECIPF